MSIKTYIKKATLAPEDIKEKTVLPVTMVFDHKIGGAADLVPFIARFDQILDNPQEILIGKFT